MGEFKPEKPALAITLMSSVGPAVSLLWWLTPTVLALGKLRRECCQMFKASLNYIGTSRLAWATYVRTYVSKRKEQTCCLVRSALCDSTGAAQHGLSTVSHTDCCSLEIQLQ